MNNDQLSNAELFWAWFAGTLIVLGQGGIIRLLIEQLIKGN